jgi:hypothetical protein
MQQQLFHSLRNAKQLNIHNCNKGKWDLWNETRKNLRNETKFYLLRNKTKRNETKWNFVVFCVSRNKQNFAKQLFCFALFRVSRNKKRKRNGNPIKMTAKSQVTAPSRSFFQQFKDQHPLFFVITWHENSVVNPKLFFFGSGSRSHFHPSFGSSLNSKKVTDPVADPTLNIWYLDDFW